jgi:hypothetical protein
MLTVSAEAKTENKEENKEYPSLMKNNLKFLD